MWKYEIWFIITSKQMQHSSCPEFGLHLWFPSSCFSRQILHTSQWKDVSLPMLKRSFWKFNDRAITSLTLFQAGRFVSQSKNYWNVLCKGRTGQCTRYCFLLQSMVHIFMTFWKLFKILLCNAILCITSLPVALGTDFFGQGRVASVSKTAQRNII